MPGYEKEDANKRAISQHETPEELDDNSILGGELFDIFSRAARFSAESDDNEKSRWNTDTDNDKYWNYRRNLGTATPPGPKTAALDNLLKAAECPQVGKNSNVKMSPKEMLKAIKIEKEHTNDPNVALEIAKDHKAEHEDYYDDKIGLPAMERRLAKKEKKKEASDSFLYGLMFGIR